MVPSADWISGPRPWWSTQMKLTWRRSDQEQWVAAVFQSEMTLALDADPSDTTSSAMPMAGQRISVRVFLLSSGVCAPQRVLRRESSSGSRSGAPPRPPLQSETVNDWHTPLLKMAHSSFATDPEEVSVLRHPNARRFYHSPPEIGRTMQWAQRGDLPRTAQVQNCLQPRNDGA